VNIALDLTYNEKTKTYSASKALSKCTTGSYDLKDISVKGKDSCGNTFTHQGNPDEKRIGLCCAD